MFHVGSQGPDTPDGPPRRERVVESLSLGRLISVDLRAAAASACLHPRHHLWHLRSSLTDIASIVRFLAAHLQ